MDILTEVWWLFADHDHAHHHESSPKETEKHSATDHEHKPHEHHHSTTDVHSLIGVTLVSGFIFMLIVDQIGGAHSHASAPTGKKKICDVLECVRYSQTHW